MKYKYFSILFTATFLLLLGGIQAEAATLYMIPNSSAFNIGEEFTIDLKAGADDEFLNAGQATVSFSNDVLELVSIDKSGSSFNFWVEEPSVSNETGTLSFIGGTTRGISGASLQIIRMKFKTKGAGVANLSITDAVLTASDGKGTNILSAVEDASVRVGTQVMPAKVLAEKEIPVILPAPVTRTPIKSTKAPAVPIIIVPLYASTTAWYSSQGDTIALWEVPNDVTGVSATIDNSPETVPSQLEPALLTGKKFGILDEGTWYVHVRFRNNVGWGKPGHYRINIDTTAPLSFDTIIDSEASENPSPEISFTTADSLSGIDLYQISLDGERISETEQNNLILPPLAPGTHTVHVRASDKAGNSTESVLSFEILPLETPVVHFYTETISKSETLFASGTSVPEGTVIFVVKDKRGNEIVKGVTTADSTGRWEFRTADPLSSSGSYTFNVMVFDTRGAQSFPTNDSTFRVRALVLFTLGSVDFGWFEILLIVILLILAVAVWFVLFIVKKGTVRGAYSTVIGRDVEKFSAMLKEEIDEVKKKVSLKKTIEDPDARTEVLYRIDKLYDTVAKMKKYLGQEIGKMKK